jgi:DNA primase
MKKEFVVHFSEVERNKIVELAQETLWNENSQDVLEALEYLRQGRGLTDSVIKSFRFGYFPSRLRHDWSGRIIMPLFDSYSKLVVLTSRNFRASKDGFPHLHEEFDKKRYLFGLDVAKKSIIKWQKAIVVEGQFDTANSHVYELDNTVGILGSAFSMHHVGLLSRYTDNIFLVFDADEAGYNSLHRSIEMYIHYGLASMGINFIPVLLPEREGNDSKDRKNDPDLFLKKNGKQAYLDLLKESKERNQELGTVNSYRYLQKNFPNLLPMLKGK